MQMPTGTITFFFTDIEGSTKLWEEHPEEMRVSLARHDKLLRKAIEDNQGYTFKTVGDAFCAAFLNATDALNAAVSAQRYIHLENWEETPLRVRMALHTGIAEERDGDYFGPPLNRVARLLSAGHGGQTLISFATQELLSKRLPAGLSFRDLGQHHLKDLTFPEHIFQVIQSDLPSDFPPLKTLDRAIGNLPRSVNSFIGRNHEIEVTRDMLVTTHLLTITGMGGAGKTRFVMELAANCQQMFPDGVWFVELAALSDPDLVPQAIASVLNIRDVGNRSIVDLLTNYLQTKRLLLVVDNCEHLVNACAMMVEALLKACPDLKILTTSREPLNIAGELVFRVPPLTTPDLNDQQSFEALVQYEAIQLFLERARAVEPRFQISEDNLSAIIQICHQLDGIPIAIELAAARVNLLTPTQISARLADRFRFLVSGHRTALPRQQTLQSLIDWSFDLLPQEEKTLMQHLAVFSGGWTLEAVEIVCAEPGHETEILEHLEQLINKSLVVVKDGTEQIRYQFLETIRQYALEKLQLSGAEKHLRERHLRYVTQIASAAGSTTLYGQEHNQWLEHIQVEYDNIRASLEWTITGSPEEALRLGSLLSHYWLNRGHLSEGKTWLRRLSSIPETPGDSCHRAKILQSLGWVQRLQSEWTVAIASGEASLEIYQQLGDVNGSAMALRTLGFAYHDLGYLEQARQLFEKMLNLFLHVDNQWGIAEACSILGHIATTEGEIDHSIHLNEQSLAIRREIGDERGIAWSLYNLANLARLHGEFSSAEQYYSEALDSFRNVQDADGEGMTLGMLGYLKLVVQEDEAAGEFLNEGLSKTRSSGNTLPSLWLLITQAHLLRAQGNYTDAETVFQDILIHAREAKNKILATTVLCPLCQFSYWRGDNQQAVAYIREALLLCQDTKAKPGIGECLITLADFLLIQGRLEKATHLLASARTHFGDHTDLPDREAADQMANQIRVKLGEATFSSLWVQGSSLDSSEVLEYALDGLEKLG